MPAVSELDDFSVRDMLERRVADNRARFTLQNLSDEQIYVYYQINYTLTDVADDVGYFHAQFRRVNPLSYKEVYSIVDGVHGEGHYAVPSRAMSSSIRVMRACLR